MSRRYRLSLLMGCPAGGVSCTGTCSPCRCGSLWGACLLCRLPPLPLVFFLPPIPPTPFPGGEGGDFLFSYARGCAPCIPGIRPPAALTEPAKQVPSGGVPPALPARRALAVPGGGLALFVARRPPPLAFFPAPYPPDPLPRWGRGGDISLFRRGLRPRHPRG